MSQKIQVTLTDDLDGTDIPAGRGETVTIALDGQTYEIDLTNKNAGALRKAMSAYISVGRGVRTSGGAKVRHIHVGPDAKTIKEWARANGYEVADRGRVPNEIRDAYAAAN